uniref:Uncharacterized protein n=1 Tax=Oryza barthii TaxID=65489 RepID=A0A0D3HCA1_9ORYZ
MAKSAWGRGGGGRVGAEAKKAVLAKRRAEARWWSRGRGAGCGPDDDGGRQRQQPRWGDNEREATTTRRHMNKKRRTERLVWYSAVHFVMLYISIRYIDCNFNFHSCMTYHEQNELNCQL